VAESFGSESFGTESFGTESLGTERAFGRRIASVSGSDGGCPRVWLADDDRPDTDRGKTVVIQGYSMPRPDDAPDGENVVAIPLGLLIDTYFAIFPVDSPPTRDEAVTDRG